MLESDNPHVNTILYVVMFIVLLGMVTWFGILPAWLSGVFGGSSLFGVRPGMTDYAVALLVITLPFAIYFIGKKKRNLLICALSVMIPYVLFEIGSYIQLIF